MCGVVAVIVVLLLALVIRTRKRRQLVRRLINPSSLLLFSHLQVTAHSTGTTTASSAFPVTDIRVRQAASESPTLIHSSKLSSVDGSSKVGLILAYCLQMKSSYELTTFLTADREDN